MLTNENEIAHKVIGCAIEIHKTLGPGLVDSVYRDCLCYELQKIDILVERSHKIPVKYKELELDYEYNIDLIIDNKIIVEIICETKVTDVELTKINKLLKLGNYNLGLIINFNSPLLKDGIRRIALNGFGRNSSDDKTIFESQNDNVTA